MNRGLQVVHEWLTDNEWSPQAMDNPFCFWDRYRIENGMLQCYFQVLPDLEQFLFLAVPMELTVPKHRRGDVGELILRLNHGMRIGSFGMDFDTGQLNFRASVNYFESEFTSQCVTNIVGPSLEAVELYLPAFLQVLEEEVAPHQAILEIDYPIDDEDEDE